MTKTYRFAHIADCHVGAWRDEKMRQLNLKVFSDSIDSIISEKVDFLLISGDLFNTAVPSIDALKMVTDKLQQLKAVGIPVYGIAGSHDYSAAGKSMLEVLEKAKLFENVMKGEVVDEKVRLTFTVDSKTGVKLCGVFGKRGTLEKKYYEGLDYASLEKESGEKIFLFHSAITELSAEAYGESQSISFLPKGFRYYAGGHVHVRLVKDIADYGKVVYPGPVCPNNFKELLELQSGSYCIVSVGESVEVKTKLVQLRPVVHCVISGDNLTTNSIFEQFFSFLESHNCVDSIVLVTIKGILQAGSSVDLSQVINSPTAYVVLRNTSQLHVPQLDVSETEHKDIASIEQEVIASMLEESKLQDKKGSLLKPERQSEIIMALLTRLAQAKLEGETSTDFEERVVKECKHIL